MRGETVRGGGAQDRTAIGPCATGSASAGPDEHDLAAGRGSGEDVLSHTARQALGYREVLEHLAGERTLAETIELVQNRTRAFARRQLTWFRSLSECRWVPCREEDTRQQLTARIVASSG